MAGTTRFNPSTVTSEWTIILEQIADFELSAFGSLPLRGLDRHRGSGCPLTPATPPCVRVRTRRFEKLRCHSSINEGRPSDLR